MYRSYKMRRERVDWMTNADVHILEFLLNEGNKEIVSTPRVVTENINFNPGYVRQRMGKLLNHDLIEYYDEKAGIYQITDQGQKYLAGELDPDKLDGQIE